MNEIGNNLKRIRLLNNLSLKEAGNLLNLSATAIAKYENGELIPNSEKIIEFADAYKVQVVELLKSYNKIEMKFTSFRKRKKLTGEKLNLLKNIIQNEVAKYLEVMEIHDINRYSKLKIYDCNNIDDAEEAANKFRNDINYSRIQPISDLINTLENLGIIIIQINNTNNLFNDFDGLSEYVNNIPVIVLLDDINDGARQRFTIAHELGHLLLNIKDNNIDEEKLANRFASSLLMPEDAVINEFSKSRSNISLYELIAFKKEYKVSIAATLYRLRDLGIISQYTYKNQSIKVNKIYGKKSEPVKIEEEKSYQFKKMVHRLEIDNIITLNKACEYLGVTSSEYNNEDNNYGY